MDDDGEVKKCETKTNEIFHRGQLIVYKGEDAQVLEVQPVFTIRIKGKSHVICGNIVNDIRPFVS